MQRNYIWEIVKLEYKNTKTTKNTMEKCYNQLTMVSTFKLSTRKINKKQKRRYLDKIEMKSQTPKATNSVLNGVAQNYNKNQAKLKTKIQLLHCTVRPYGRCRRGQSNQIHNQTTKTMKCGIKVGVGTLRAWTRLCCRLGKEM